MALTTDRLGGTELMPAALHHDSHEAYICDVPRPLKLLLQPRYSEITTALDHAIAGHFGLGMPSKESSEGQLIKRADDAVLKVEADSLLRGGTANLGLMPAEVHADVAARRAAVASIGDLDAPWSPETAEDNFRRVHQKLGLR